MEIMSSAAVDANAHNQNDPRVTLRWVTPELAAQWLATNENNRNLRERLVRKLAGAIKRGEWRLNGDTIRFDQNGKLVDGQHRLAAIVHAQTPIETFVAEGIDRSAQVTMDTGAKRTLADALKLRGENDVNVLAATLRMYWRYLHGQLRYFRVEATHEELLKLLDEHPTIRDSVSAVRATKTLRISHTTASTAHYICSRGNPEDEDAKYFFQRLLDGVDLEEDSPIRRLREWLLTTAGTKTKHTPTYVLALYIKAWNAYIEGRPVKALRWRVGGSNPEPFPKPVYSNEL